jgi:hypothetical protein
VVVSFKSLDRLAIVEGLDVSDSRLGNVALADVNRPLAFYSRFAGISGRASLNFTPE